MDDCATNVYVERRKLVKSEGYPRHFGCGDLGYDETMERVMMRRINNGKIAMHIISLALLPGCKSS